MAFVIMDRLAEALQFRLGATAIVKTMQVDLDAFAVQGSQCVVDLENAAVVGWEWHVEGYDMKMFVQLSPLIVDKIG
jgi:hypothetical protein